MVAEAGVPGGVSPSAPRSVFALRCETATCIERCRIDSVASDGGQRGAGRESGAGGRLRVGSREKRYRNRGHRSSTRTAGAGGQEQEIEGMSMKASLRSRL